MCHQVCGGKLTLPKLRMLFQVALMQCSKKFQEIITDCWTLNLGWAVSTHPCFSLVNNCSTVLNHLTANDIKINRVKSAKKCNFPTLNERGYNPETPSNFQNNPKQHHWMTHPPKLKLVVPVIWWNCLGFTPWQTPRSSSLDWASIEVTLGQGSEVSVGALVGQCWG